MDNRGTVFVTCTLPMALKYKGLRSYALTAAFVSLNVVVPWAFHQFHLAGATFLPMHIFVFVAALASGWRHGLLVGLLTPVASYAISGMPALLVLPQITVELSAYGLIAGALREKYGLRAVWSLLAAMVGGRMALLLTTSAIYLVTGGSYSPLGPEPGPILALWSAIKQGWPGIAVQIVSIPLIVRLVEKLALRLKPQAERSTAGTEPRRKL